MNDTVTTLIELADEYAAAAHNYFTNPNSKPKWEEMVAARQALQDELTRLFTPLTDEQIKKQTDVFVWLDDPDDFRSGVKWAEEEHGITGEKNEVA